MAFPQAFYVVVKTSVAERGLEILYFSFLNAEWCLTVAALSRETRALPSFFDVKHTGALTGVISECLMDIVKNIYLTATGAKSSLLYEYIFFIK